MYTPSRGDGLGPVQMAMLYATIQKAVSAYAKLASKLIHFALQEIGDPNSSTCIGKYLNLTDCDR